MKGGRILAWTGGLIGAVLINFQVLAQPSSEDAVAVAQAAIVNALVAGAADHARIELAAARAKLAEAKRVMGQQDYEGANRLAAEAAGQARLAEAKAGIFQGRGLPTAPVTAGLR